MIKKLLYFFIIIFSVFSCQKKDTEKEKQVSISLQEILERKEIRVGIINNPVSYFIYKGTPMGFHYELIKDYTERLGIALKLVIVPDYASAIEMIENRELDILSAGFSITKERKNRMLFTKPLLRSNAVLVQNRNSKRQYIEDILNIDSMEVAVINESTSEIHADNLEEILGITITKHLYDGLRQEEIIELVATDSVPATIADKIIAQVSHISYPNLDIGIDVGLTQNIAWILPMGYEELQQSINNWLTEIKDTQKYKHLYTKYFRNKKSILRNKEGYLVEGEKLSNYDNIIKEEAALLGWDWRLLGALIYTESRFDPNVKSWAGAFGIMQMMPVTARKFGVSSHSSVKEQIMGGRKYIQYLENTLGEKMQDKTDLNKFVIASYNSGLGHIEDAIQLTKKYNKDPESWEDVKGIIEKMKEQEYYDDEVVKYGFFRGTETLNHVERVFDLYENYCILLPSNKTP